MNDVNQAYTSNGKRRLVTRLFRDCASAECAYQSISDREYDPKDIRFVISDETRRQHFSGAVRTKLGNKAEGAGMAE